MTSGPPTLQARGVSKAFGRTVALSDVALDLHAGEAHGLVGENGAGKSSLLKILTGIYRADSGTLALDGRPYAPRSPEEARSAGLALVPQELRIVPAMTVADNVLLGRWPTRGGAVDHRRMLEQAADALARLGLRLDPRATMGSLSFAERQAVVLAREVGTEATRVLILDEPTASLERAEVDRLFALVARLRERRVGVLFVSHRLDEVRHLCDRVTVLRDGRLVAVHARGQFTEADLARDMTGRVLDAAHAPGDRAAGEELLSLPLGEERISLRRGRVSGLAGLLGSGSGELLRRIFGAADARDAGLRVHGQARRVASPADAIAAGFGYVPSERARALVPALSVRDNIVLPHLARFTSRLGGYDAAAADRAVLDLVRRLDIRPADPSLPARALSGGNQQKLLFARWLMGEFHTLLLDEPTHGIDVAAKRQVLRLVDRFATEGGGVLLASAELHEILAIADDIVALRDGRPRLRITRGSPDFTEGALRSALGA